MSRRQRELRRPHAVAPAVDVWTIASTSDVLVAETIHLPSDWAIGRGAKFTFDAPVWIDVLVKDVVASPDDVVEVAVGPVGSTSLLRHRHASSTAQAQRIFAAVQMLVPSRLCNEDLGDWLEKIAALERAGASPGRCRIVLVAALFWTVTNVVRELRSVWLGKFRGGGS